jgi:hypothetical protein
MSDQPLSQLGQNPNPSSALARQLSPAPGKPSRMLWPAVCRPKFVIGRIAASTAMSRVECCPPDWGGHIRETTGAFGQ